MFATSVTDFILLTNKNHDICENLFYFAPVPGLNLTDDLLMSPQPVPWLAQIMFV